MLKSAFRINIVLATFAIVLAPSNATAQIVPGVTQSAAHTANVTGTVTQSDGTPVAGADVKLAGPAIVSTTSNDRGVFSFASVPWGTYQITVTSVLGTFSRGNAVINGDINIAIAYQSRAGLQTIAHVSTSSAGAQINVTPASIASVSPSEYAFQGNTSWKELLNQIPGVTVGGDLFGGRSTLTNVPDGPFQPIVLSINGALPYETSTTLDGMPLYNQSVTIPAGSGTNLSYLPMPMFDTADVVRGPGADAPSIIDSIGGSFVLHAPGRVEKNEAEFSYSNDAYGGSVANAKAELRLGKLSAVITYGFYDSPGPLEGTQYVMPGLTLNPATVNGQAWGSSGLVGYTNPKYNPAYFTSLGYTLLFCCAPLSTAWIQHNGAIGLSYDITPSITAQVFYAGSASSMPDPISKDQVSFMPGPGYTGSLVPGSYLLFNVEGSDDIAQSQSLLEEKVTAYTGGGVIRVAALQANSFSQCMSTSLPNGQYRLYGSGTYANSTPAVFNGTLEPLTFSGTQASNFFALHSWTDNRDLLGSYAAQVGSASSVGLSYVTSYYNGPSSLQCCAGFSLSTPSAISETTDEVRLYGGTKVSDNLSVDASWYFATGSYHVTNPNNPNQYADSVFPYNAPRLGAVWRAGQNIAIRVAAGGGYALPALSSLVGSNGAIDCSSGIFCSISLTNLKLQPETSFGFDLGTDMRVNRATVLSVDLYRTNLYGQFYTSVTNAGTFNALPLYKFECGNLSQSRYAGVNLDIRHDVPKGIYWHGALGLSRAYVVNVPAGFYNDPTVPCKNCANTYILTGSNFNGFFQSTVPYANGTAQIGYRWSPGKYIDLSPTYYGNGNPYYVPAFVEFDAHAGFALTKNVSLLVTFRNITGAYDLNYAHYGTVSTGAENIAGSGLLPNPLFEIPFGPRSAIVTLNLRE